MSDDARKTLPAEARQLIAHARNDITIPYYTSVLQPQDDTLIQRGDGRGVGLYDEIERDPHAYAVLQKRKLALVAREWVVEPASDAPTDKKAAEFVEGVLKAISFDRLCLDLLDATLKGYSVAEIVWKRDGAAIVPARVVGHDARRFTFDLDWRPRLLTLAAPLEGEALPERKFVTHRFGVRGNNPFGLGLGTRLFWAVLFKREGVAFWLKFLEKFGSPTPVGKYPQGTLPEQQQALLQSLLDSVQSGAIVAPLGSEVTYLEATHAGQASYAEWCKYWDMQMALAVFGSTLATHVEGQGSRAASETHKEAEEQIIDADGDLLADTLKATLGQWLVDYNLPGASPPSIRRIRPKNETAHEDLRQKKAANARSELDLLFDLAAATGPEKFAEAAAALAGVDIMPNIPLDVLKRLAPHIASARQNLNAAAARGALPMPADANGVAAVRQIAFAERDDTLDSLVDQLDELAGPHIDATIAAFRAALMEGVRAGESGAALDERLLKAVAGVSVDPLGNLFGGAFAVAEASGRVAAQAMTRKR